MKMILSTLASVILLAGTANASTFDPFRDPKLALPRSSGYEQALPRTSNDEFRQALPRTGNDATRQMPLSDAYPDVVVALP
jgi:hypothetical protein